MWQGRRVAIGYADEAPGVGRRGLGHGLFSPRVGAGGPGGRLAPRVVGVVNVDRHEAARAIAKVFAFLASGKREEARTWARQLIEWLETI